MQHRRLGSSDLNVSVIALGNMAWPHCYYGETAGPGARASIDRPAIEKLVATAIDNGITLFDTAEGYGRGLAETLLGDALRSLGKRKEVCIVTKVGPLFASEQVGGRGCNLSAAHIRERCEASLSRLHTDTIDLYLAHHPDPGTPVEETVRTMMGLQRQGKIRYFGVSNFSVPLLAEAQRYGALSANQLPYSLIQREIEAAQLPYCLRSNISVMAHSPLGKGMLSGKYSATNLPPQDDYRRDRFQFSPQNVDRHLAVASRCAELASGLGITPGQLALAWVLAQPGVAVAVPGGKNIDQIVESAKAGSVVLPEAVVAELTQLTR